MKRTTLLAAVLATTLAWATPSAADTILWDPNGGNDTNFNATIFDWFPGNALLIETDAPAPGDPGSGQILFQANLNSVQLTSGLSISNGISGDGSFITIVAVVDVTLTTIGGALDANTALTATGGTIFIYADNELGRNDLGTGFTDGTLILQATITGGGGTFDADPLVSATPIDQFTSALGLEPAGDQYPGVLTLTGSGGSDIEAVVSFLAGGYFNNLQIGSSLAFTNTSTIDPYRQTNPSNAFSTNGMADGNLTGVITGAGPGINGLVCGTPLNTADTCINGTGSYIVAQADANTSFTITPGVVPEPATLTLLGLGLIGAAAFRRRRATK